MTEALRLLAERVEKATGPDRELDRDIANGAHGYARDGSVPHFTASLDAAMSLVPPGWAYKIGRNWCELWPMSPDVPDEQWPDDWNEDRQHYGATSALALCAAALRARAAQEQRNEP